MIAAESFGLTLSLEEKHARDGPSDDRGFHLNRAFRGGYLADADQSISDEKPFFLQSGQYADEQRRQCHLFDLCLQPTPRARLVPAQLQFAHDRHDARLVFAVRRSVSRTAVRLQPRRHAVPATSLFVPDRVSCGVTPAENPYVAAIEYALRNCEICNNVPGSTLQVTFLGACCQ